LGKKSAHWQAEVADQVRLFTVPDNILNEKKNEQDSTRPDFWSQRYSSGKTPWQLDHAPARVTAFIRSLETGRNVLIPGCGQDFRTIDAFRRAGHRVTAIDFSPIAVESTRKAIPEISGHLVLGDFFTHDFKAAPFDLIYERTFLCSLPPSLWKSYAARVGQLLLPDGVLAGFFFYGEESDPPPYPLTEQKAAEIFGDRFELEKSESVADPLSIFAGKEKWQEWRLQS
jgi:hypothetical protein